MKRLHAIACLIVLAMGVAAWLVSYSPDALPDDNQTPPQADADDTIGGAQGREPGGASQPSDGSETARTDATPQSVAEASGTAKQLIHLHGTFVVVDARGLEHVVEDGQFSTTLHHSETSSEWAITKVKDGKWQLEAEELPSHLQVNSTWLGRRPVICKQMVPIHDTDASIALRGRWQPQLDLHVVADATGVDVTDVQLVTVTDPPSILLHPGDINVTTVVEHGGSPLQCDAPLISRAQTFWAKATGFAWQPIKLDTTSDTKRIVRLPPGGSVSVSLEGGEVPYRSRLRVRRPGAAKTDVPIAEVSVAAKQTYGLLGGFPFIEPGKTLVEGLPVGDWSLTLEEGEWSDPIVMGTAAVTIITGATASATIRVHPTQASRLLAPIAGSLVLPKSWGTAIRLEITSRERITSSRRSAISLPFARMKNSANSTYSFDAGQLLVGDYQVCVHGTQYRTQFSLPASGRQDLVITVPEPRFVRLRIVDAETNRDVQAAVDLSWFSKPKGWAGHCSAEHMVGTRLGYQCTAPVGPITFRVRPVGYRAKEQTFEVREDPNEFVMRVQRDCGVALVLKDGNNTVPWPDNHIAKLTDSTGKSVVAHCYGNRISAMRPGECTLVVPRIQGYDPIAKQVVVVNAWQYTTVEIQLRRKL